MYSRCVTDAQPTLISLTGDQTQKRSLQTKKGGLKMSGILYVGFRGLDLLPVIAISNRPRHRRDEQGSTSVENNSQALNMRIEELVLEGMHSLIILIYVQMI